MKPILLGLFLFLILLSPARMNENAHSSTWLIPEEAKSAGKLVQELILAVNQLRERNGLNALNAHPILMSIAQNQANYNATIENSTHLSADGLRPFQRALAAGYPIAGDLDQGGFYSENIIQGAGVSAQDVVNAWMGDELHMNTMLSEYRTDLGVGVAYNGDTAYFVLDTALYSRWPVTPPPVNSIENPPSAPRLAPVNASTPEKDGSIIHKVHSGETLWTIAAAYGLSVEDLIRINQRDPQRFIQPDELLTIRLAQPLSSTPDQATDTPSERTPSLTRTLRPTQSPEPSPEVISTQQESQKESPSPLVWVVLLGTLITLGVVLILGFMRKT